MSARPRKILRGRNFLKIFSENCRKIFDGGAPFRYNKYY